MKWREHSAAADHDGPSVALSGELLTDDVIIRQLTAEDAAAVAQRATSIGYVWGDLLPVPASEQEAADLIADWESVGASGTGTLVGLFAVDDGRLLAVAAVSTHGLTGQLAGWGTADPAERDLSVQGLVRFADFLQTCGLVRLSMDVPPHDRLTRFLVFQVGFGRGGTVTREDGTTWERLSLL